MPDPFFKSLATVALVSTASLASAAPVLSLQPASTTITAGQIATINLVLDGSWSTAIRSVELDLSTPTNGAGYVAVLPNLDGFAESLALTAALTTTTDGSLLNDPSLGYAAGVGLPGFAAGSGPIVLGSFYLQTPAGVARDYTLSIPFVEILDAANASLNTSVTATVVHATVPEPAVAGVAALGVMTLARRRRAR